MDQKVSLILQQQYQYICSSRNTIIGYIGTIADEDFLSESSTFGRGSIRNLLVHICDTYAAWIGKRSLGMDIVFAPFETYQNLDACITYFSKVDQYIAQFIDQYCHNYEQELDIHRNSGEVLKISPLRLFTHVTTHEFHHKGQIMSLSRHLGYTPIDADIIR